MSTTEIPDVTVLAAIDRAERHRGRPGVPVWLIFEHLGIPRRSRRVRAQLQALVEGGSIEQRRAHGVDVWALASNGRRRLRGAGRVDLPESPQHRQWRNARTPAAQEIERFRASRWVTLPTEASALLDDTPGSDVWFELAEGLEPPRGDSGRRPTVCTSGWSQTTIGRTSTTTSVRPICRLPHASVSDAKPGGPVDATLVSGRARILRGRTRRFDRPSGRSCGWCTEIRWPLFAAQGH